MSLSNANPAAEGRPWRRALAWLLVLGPFFFLSYGLATWASSQRSDVGSIVFSWERHIPLLPWTILPYWAMDLFYGVSLLLCTTRRQLDTHASRLLLTQLLAVSCFLLFPLRCTFERGEVSGAFGWMFDALMTFDQPYNQAPSLHIALLVVLLEPYLRAVPRACQGLVVATALLIGVSVLTTWQHHFFDIPTGLWLGCLVVWVFPTDAGSPLRRAALSRERAPRRLATAYATAALAVGGSAAYAGGGWLWLLWPAGSLALVATIYLLLDAEAFEKRADGSFPLAVRWLLGPYLLGAWLNSRWWTRQLAAVAPVAPGVLLGRLPTPAQVKRLGVTAIVDVCAELPCPTPGLQHAVVPMLDLVVPDPQQIERASAAIAEAPSGGPVLVCCALGLARSALVAAAWLLRAGIATSPEEAVALVLKARPAVVLGQAQIDLLHCWWQGYLLPNS
ncbi:MAG: phosphatase PAP2/dual specificity phosphatase family protein [Candidatus Accumulibacter sp.]|uniref:Phosphatase PAP2/dual specificity phosphatase family protein n=1 Tax=Candidatus Accumulibacter affinis TaxID=2954384 RepID=A0A935W1W0_9PROT|nr:phosphatase PAP2/dual specificity phosphatase family protein [Candidatus Accumulibacter affinis]